MEDKPQPQPSGAPPLPAAVTAASSNFALFSAALIILSVFCATVFLYAYVRVFDWRLIWLVEYTDILKVGLIAIAFFSGFYIFVFVVVHDAFKTVVAKDDPAWWMKYIGPIAGAALFASFLYAEYKTDQPRYALVVSTFLSAAFVFPLMLWGAILRNNFRSMEGKYFILVLFPLMGSVATFGSTFGYYARDGGRGSEQDIVLEDKETLWDARLVMLTSRHAVIYHDGTTITVRADAIKRMVTRRQP